ncbi:hypothetical protein IGI39_004800 [Enterococcus sp. AZ135]|uniref:transposase n=1 Tax=unclassified Enterococcus TaxID=2608891 RepID=UPI003F2630DC
MSKRYTKEFKQTILDLYKQGKSAQQLSLEYEIGYSTVLKWVQGSTKTSPDGLTPDVAKEIRKLLKEKDEEITILKKALGLLAKK